MEQIDRNLLLEFFGNLYSFRSFSKKFPECVLNISFLGKILRDFFANFQNLWIFFWVGAKGVWPVFSKLQSKSPEEKTKQESNSIKFRKVSKFFDFFLLWTRAHIFFATPIYFRKSVITDFQFNRALFLFQTFVETATISNKGWRSWRINNFKNQLSKSLTHRIEDFPVSHHVLQIKNSLVSFGWAPSFDCFLDLKLR